MEICWGAIVGELAPGGNLTLWHDHTPANRIVVERADIANFLEVLHSLGVAPGEHHGEARAFLARMDTYFPDQHETSEALHEAIRLLRQLV